MHLDDQTLGSLLGAPEISPVAKDAIRGRDLSLEPLWHQSLRQIRDQHLLSGDIGLGLDRLGAADFQPLRRGIGVQGHVLGLEGRGTVAVLLENAAKGRRDDTLADVTARTGKHDGMQTLHVGHSFSLAKTNR